MMAGPWGGCRWGCGSMGAAGAGPLIMMPSKRPPLTVHRPLGRLQQQPECTVDHAQQHQIQSPSAAAALSDRGGAWQMTRCKTRHLYLARTVLYGRYCYARVRHRQQRSTTVLAHAVYPPGFGPVWTGRKPLSAQSFLPRDLREAVGGFSILQLYWADQLGPHPLGPHNYIHGGNQVPGYIGEEQPQICAPLRPPGGKSRQGCDPQHHGTGRRLARAKQNSLQRHGTTSPLAQPSRFASWEVPLGQRLWWRRRWSMGRVWVMVTPLPYHGLSLRLFLHLLHLLLPIGCPSPLIDQSSECLRAGWDG